MLMENIPPTAESVESDARWHELVAEYDRLNAAFLATTSDTPAETAAHAAWSAIFEQLIAMPAPSVAAVHWKMAQFEEYSWVLDRADVAAIRADLARFAGVDEGLPTDAQAWLDRFEQVGGCYVPDGDAVAFFIAVAHRSDADVLAGRRMHDQLHADRALHGQVTQLVAQLAIEGRIAQ